VGRPQSRSFLAVGMDWAARVTTIALEFALPPLLGSLADRWLLISPWLTVVGAVLGFVVGMMHVLRLAHEPPPSS
jgi:ATP synthase protein I